MPPCLPPRRKKVKNVRRSTTRKAWPGRLSRPGFRRAAAAVAPADPAAGTVVWIYAVTPDFGAQPLSGVTGVAGEPVRVVTEAGLAAVVGSVDRAVFGEESLTSLLTDLATVEMVGRAHHQVIASTASAGPVVPLRLATTYPDDATIRMQLAERRAELTGMLQVFAGRQEWGVKVYVEPWSDAGLAAEARAEEIGEALSAIAVATRRHPAAGLLSGDQARWMVLNDAYLLSTERAAEFNQTVRALTAEHDAFQADVTGPWPPYSFADR
jgi:hypothetical protein